MREIKFRAWDNQFKRMKVSGMGINQGVLSHEEPDIIMQYTGLKDRNGVEIYESDVVEYTFPITRMVVKGAVVWADVEACWIIYDGDNEREQSRLMSGLASRCKVIGNIYEVKS